MATGELGTTSTLDSGVPSREEFAAHLEKVYERISTAVRDKDPDSFVALYAEDGALMTPDGALVKGHSALREAFVRWTEAGWVGQRAELVELVLADGLVSEEGRSEGTFSIDGETTVARNNYLATHVRSEDGHWVMHRDIWNTVPDVPTSGSY